MNRQKLWPYNFHRSEKTIDLTRLPRPTNQPDQLKQDLSEFGYCLYNSAFSLEKLDEIKKQIYLQIEAEKKNGLQIKNETGSIICANLLNKDEVFQSLVTIPEVDALVEHLLGHDFFVFGRVPACQLTIAALLDAGAHRVGCHAHHLPA